MYPEQDILVLLFTSVVLLTFIFGSPTSLAFGDTVVEFLALNLEERGFKLEL